MSLLKDPSVIRGLFSLSTLALPTVARQPAHSRLRSCLCTDNVQWLFILRPSAFVYACCLSYLWFIGDKSVVHSAASAA